MEEFKRNASTHAVTVLLSDHHYWGGRIAFHKGSVKVPTKPGLGVEIDPVQLARLHQQYLDCGVRNRNDLAQMRKYDPAFTGVCPRF